MHLPSRENDPRVPADLGVSLVLIPHNNQDRLRQRLERDLLPTIAAHPDWKFQLVTVDNSDVDNRPAYNVEGFNILHTSFWPGSNIMYGPAMNLAIGACAYPYVVYLCSNHGHMYDPTWIDDLIEPLIREPSVAMTGSAYPSCRPEEMGFPSGLPSFHIQGGLFAARTEVMRAYPYTSDERWVHWGSDIYQSFCLLAAGFELRDVLSIKSVWRQCVEMPERWKYVHDYSEG
jgi:hypothetical protein